MIKINYPTIKMVEKFLSLFFNSKLNLTQCINSLGYNMGKGAMYALYGANVPGARITGIDISILISDSTNNSSNGTIMIIEQDPLRNYKQFLPIYGPQVLQQNAIMGTPNAFHYKPVNFYFQLVDGLIKKGWTVYITDTNKVYAEQNIVQRKKYIFSPQQNKLQEQLLVDEINTIKPNIVLLFGADSQKAYSNIVSSLNNSPKCINILHPSGVANRWWKAKYSLSQINDSAKVNYVLNLIP